FGGLAVGYRRTQGGDGHGKHQDRRHGPEPRQLATRCLRKWALSQTNRIRPVEAKVLTSRWPEAPAFPRPCLASGAAARCIDPGSGAGRFAPLPPSIPAMRPVWTDRLDCVPVPALPGNLAD